MCALYRHYANNSDDKLIFRDRGKPILVLTNNAGHYVLSNRGFIAFKPNSPKRTPCSLAPHPPDVRGLEAGSWPLTVGKLDCLQRGDRGSSAAGVRGGTRRGRG